MKKYLFGLLMIIVIAIPLCALAGGLEGPLVPCGRQGQPACTLCDIFIMVQNIIDFIFVAIFILAPIYVLWGGFEILTSAGETGKVSNGKKKITAAVVGIVIALVAWTGLNMGFNALVSVGPGFPWPWNEVKCEGGGIIGGEEVYTYCHLQYKGEPDVMALNYDTEEDCNQECTKLCDLVIPRENCEAWCCLGENKSGQDNVCEEIEEGQWCQRSAPSGSEKWKIGGPMSKNQFGDASSGLVGLINCMYGKLSNFVITAISSSVLCNNPSCDITGPSCGHAANSCHFGGTNCTGTSYAVDFASNIDYSTTNTAAKQCNSSVWTNWETNHTHISIPGCGCQ